jgi:hypothetical protein
MNARPSIHILAIAATLTLGSLRAVSAQETQSPAGPTVEPRASLEKFCDDIRDVFALAKFNGEYRLRVDAFVAHKCAGAVPLPRAGDRYNIQRFNTSAGILQSGGIVIAPN